MGNPEETAMLAVSAPGLWQILIVLLVSSPFWGVGLLIWWYFHNKQKAARYESQQRMKLMERELEHRMKVAGHERPSGESGPERDPSHVMYTPRECRVCVVPPLVFVSNAFDGTLRLYCYECRAVYGAPDGVDRDSAADMDEFRPATLVEIKEAGFEERVRAVPASVRFP